MKFLLLSLVLSVSPIDIIKTVENDLNVTNTDPIYLRYLYLDNISDDAKDDYLTIVSFVLNSISMEKKITKPEFVDDGKTVIRFDLRDYKIKPDNYNSLGKDYYISKHYTQNLLKTTNSINPILRADLFIIKTMSTPGYYKFLESSSLKDFRERVGYTDEDSGVKAAVVVNSKLARETRFFKRIPTVYGYIWEARDSAKINYLKDLLSDNYDSIQLVASNPNGLLSYFAADSKGKSLEHLNPNTSVDHHGLYGDYVVRVSRSCVGCHTTGIIGVQDEIRTLFGNFDILIIDEHGKNKFKNFFSGDLPIKADRKKYSEALQKATDLEPIVFASKFLAVWREYYKDLTIEQAAKEMGMGLKEFKDFCLKSGDPHLMILLIRNKIPRLHFEEFLGEK